MLLAIENKLTAMARNSPLQATRPSRLALPSKMVDRFDKANRGFLRQHRGHLGPDCGWVLMPVPTAVPPAGNS